MTTVKGSWELQDVRDKALAGIWKEYDASGDPFTIYMWGRNNQGNLGQNNRTDYSSPVQVPGTTWKQCDRGDNGCVVAVKTDGTLWSWGTSDNGVLGQNNNVRKSSPVQVPGTTWHSVNVDSSNAMALKS